MRTLKVIISIIILQLVGHNAIAFSPDSLISIGNNAYNEGLYDSALNVYSQVEARKLQSAQLYYNMGNAYYKNKDIPSAILYYEKAKKLSPSDENIQYNLDIANSMIVDKIDKVPELFFKTWWNYFYNLFNADWWTVIALTLLLASAIFITWFLISRSRSVRKLAFYAGIFSVLLTITAFGLASQKYYYSKQHVEAIVFTPSITIKSSPTASAVDLFVIHEGTKVRLLDKVAGWVEIRIPDGSVGWLPEDAIRNI